MAKSDYTIRLATEGDDTVKATFADTATAAEQSADRTVKAYDRTAAAADRAAQKEKERRDALRAQAEALFAPSGNAAPGSPADAPAQNFGTLADQRRAKAAALALRDQLDPASKAQREFNTEVASAEELLKKGVITEAEYTGAVKLAEQALQKAKAALNEHSNAIGLNRMQYITAQSAALRFTDSIIAGRNPLTAFALEAHKGVEVLSLDDGGMAGGLSKVSGLLTPATVGVAALTAALVAGITAGISYSEQLDKMALAADGFGRTSQLTGAQLLELAQKHSAAAGISVKAASDVETAILGQTRTSSEALGKAIDISQAWADAMGLDAKKGAEDLAKALADPAKAADELTSKFGYLTQAQVEQIHQLVEQNRLTDAQASLLDDMMPKLIEVEKDVSALTEAWRKLSSAMSNGWANVGAAMRHAVGDYTDAEKQAALNADIQQKLRFLNDPNLLPSRRVLINAQLQAEQQQYTALAEAAQKSNADAWRDSEAEWVKSIERSSGATNKYSLQLEDLRKTVNRLHQDMAKGIPVDPTVLGGKEHQLRGLELIGGDGNREAAMQQAQARYRAALRRHDTAGAGAARSDVEAIRTAGRDMTDAQALAADQAAGIARGRGSGGDKHAEQLARDAASMQVAAAAALKLGDAYLVSGDAALRAEAYKKAATDATKRGIDIDAQAARQLALDGANQIANTDKTSRGLADEAAARQHVMDMVNNGTIAAKDMDRELAAENALRPLLAYQTILHGDALDALKRAVEGYRNAAAQAAQADKDWAVQQQINADIERTRVAILAGNVANESPLDRAKDTALANAANIGASRKTAIKASGAAGAAATAEGDTWAKQQRVRISLEQQLADLDRQTSREKSADYDVELQAQKLLIQAQQDHRVLSQQDATDLAARTVALKKYEDQTARVKAAYQQLRDDGANALDQLLNPDNINHWGDTFKSVLRGLLFDIEKMGAINPFENWLLGGNRPTLQGGGGGLLGFLGGLFGGGITAPSASLTADALNTINSGLPFFASGTDSAPGGPTMVGEDGPELVNLPTGSRVLTASQTKRQLTNDNPSVHVPINISIDATGADAAELARLRAELTAVKTNLPGQIIATVTDAHQRTHGRWLNRN